VIKRKNNEKWIEYIKTLFSYDQLKKILAEKKLKYGVDVNLCKLVDNKKHVFNKKEPNVKLAYLEDMFQKNKVTIQFHQPQRFSDPLWKLIEKFECYFQCLVGSNIYITPSETQGLAPHHDDIEAFVIQLEGSKHWLLYKPVIELPNEYSQDMDPSVLKEPTHDIILETGDIMYFPRGTIHQAKTPQNEHDSYSTHVTVSTYQNFNNMEFVNSIIQEEIAKNFDSDLKLRKGLPIGFFRKENFDDLFNATIASIKFENVNYPKAMLKDFMGSRLPPYDHEGAEECASVPFLLLKEFSEASKEAIKIRLKYPDHIYVTKAAENDGSDVSVDSQDADECQDEIITYVYYSNFNLRSNHMMEQGDDTNCLKTKGKYFDAMKTLVNDNSKNEWMSIAQLAEKSNSKGEDLKDLLISLAGSNLIEVSE